MVAVGEESGGGFVDFFVKKYGAVAWSETQRRLGPALPQANNAACCPCGTDTLKEGLLTAAEKVLNVKREGLLRGFGGHYVESMVQDPLHMRVLSCLGPTLVDILANALNDLHLHIGLGLEHTAKSCLPDLRLVNVTDTSAELHCHSTGRNAQYVMEGAVIALGREIFGIEVEMELLRGQGTAEKCDHEVYLLSFPKQEQCAAEKQVHLQDRACMNTYTPSPQLFYRMFPFHFIVDSQCRLVQLGLKLEELLPSMKCGSHISDVFKIRHPERLSWDFESINGLAASAFVLEMAGHHACCKRVKGLQLKGQFWVTDLEDGHPALLFMGSLRVSGLEEMQARRLFISDIPPHDMTRDMVLTSVRNKEEESLMKGLQSEYSELMEDATAMEEEMMKLEKTVQNLRETLLDTLNMRQGQLEDGQDGIDMDTPAEKALGVIDSFLFGEQVTVQSALEARQAIISGGCDLHRPLHFREQMLKMTGMDKDVNQALIAMLGNAAVEEWDGQADDQVTSGSLVKELKDQEKSSLTSTRAPSRLGQSKSHKPRRSISFKLPQTTPNLVLPFNSHQASAAFPYSGDVQRTPCAETEQPGAPTMSKVSREMSAPSGSKKEPRLNENPLFSGDFTESDFHHNDISPAVPPVDDHKEDGTQPAPKGYVSQPSSKGYVSQPSSPFPSGALDKTQSLAGSRDTSIWRFRSRREGSPVNEPSAQRGTEGDMETPIDSNVDKELASNQTYSFPSGSFTKMRNQLIGAGALRSRRSIDLSNTPSAPLLKTDSRLFHSRRQASSPLGPELSNMMRADAIFSNILRADGSLSHATTGSSLQSEESTTRRRRMSVPNAPVIDPSVAGVLVKQGVEGLMMSEEQRQEQQLEQRLQQQDLVPALWNRRKSMPLVHSSEVTYEYTLLLLRQTDDMTVGGMASVAIGPDTSWTPHNVTLPKSPKDELHVLLAKVEDWGFDTFQLDEVTSSHSLSVLAFALIKRLEVFKKFRLDESKLARFLIEVESGYFGEQYHCSAHAADVLRTLHSLITRGGIWKQIQGTDLGLLAIYLAAVVHDYGHRGVNNDFLIKAQHKLALLYNDRSPMENHHASATWMMLIEDKHNFINKLPAKAQESLRKMVIEMVMATDMKQVAAAAVKDLKDLNPTIEATQDILNSQIDSTISNVIDAVSCSHLNTLSTLHDTIMEEVISSSQNSIPFSNQRATPTTTSTSNSNLEIEGEFSSLDSIMNSSRQNQRPRSFFRVDRLEGPKGDSHQAPNSSTRTFRRQGSITSPSPLSRTTAAPPKKRSSFLYSQKNAGPSSLMSVRSMRKSHSAINQEQAPQIDWDEESRLLAMQMTLKWADTGHLAAPLDVHLRWVHRLEEEMFRQGDQEKSRGLPVSPLMDRLKQGITKSQTGFFNFVALPSYQLCATAFPSCTPILTSVRLNYAHWEEKEEEAAALDAK